MCLLSVHVGWERINSAFSHLVFTYHIYLRGSLKSKISTCISRLRSNSVKICLQYCYLIKHCVFPQFSYCEKNYRESTYRVLQSECNDLNKIKPKGVLIKWIKTTRAYSIVARPHVNIRVLRLCGLFFMLFFIK